MSRFITFTFAIFLAACSGPVGEPDAASYAFVNGRVYTANESAPWAEAVVVSADRIVYVGDADGASALIGAETIVRDLGGKLMLPGLIDSHMHPVGAGAYAKAVVLSIFEPIDEWVQKVAAHAAANPDDDVIFGYGFLASTFGTQGPTRELLDAVVPDRPVLIMDEGYHGAWLNTAALDALNITRDTPDPQPGFSYYRRDANGDATGYLLENTTDLATEGLGLFTEDSVAAGMAIVIGWMNAYGITAVFDGGETDIEHMIPAVMRRVEQDGDLTVRVVGARRAQRGDSIDDVLANVADWTSNVKGQRYHYNTLKIQYDGTIEGRTAALFEPYQGEPDNYGDTKFSEQELIDIVTAVAGRGTDIHIHGIGDRAVHEALNAIEAARREHPDSDSRYTICHLEIILDEDIERFAQLDVIAQSSPYWAAYDEAGKAFINDDQFQRYWRYKSLEDAGVRLTFGTDFPASGTGDLKMSPFAQIEVGHTRQYDGVPDAPIQPRESERLSIDTLVRGYTIDAAYQLRMENEIGSIEVGKKADLAVLDQDIFAIDPYSIHKTTAVLTMMDGDIVYEKED